MDLFNFMQQGTSYINIILIGLRAHTSVRVVFEMLPIPLNEHVTRRDTDFVARFLSH